jgi:hypothetical protein
MPLRHFRALVAVLALGAAVILPWSAAAEPGRDAFSLCTEGTGSASWNLVAQAWRVLVSLWGEEGCMIDPSGRCAPEEATTPSDIGCGIDPDGRCAPAAATTSSEIGCGIDPNGLWHSDIGCILDPDG